MSNDLNTLLTALYVPDRRLHGEDVAEVELEGEPTTTPHDHVVVTSGAWQVVLFFGLGLVYLSLARLRTRIDHQGVAWTSPLLGGTGKLVRFQEILAAELAPRPLNMRFPATMLGTMSGYTDKTEPALVLHLIDGREINVTVNHPWYAANIVNHELHRLRTSPADHRYHH